MNGLCWLSPATRKAACSFTVHPLSGSPHPNSNWLHGFSCAGCYRRENQAKWVETLGLFPLRASSMELLKDYSNSHRQWNAALTLLPNAGIQPQLASWRKVQIMLGDRFSHVFVQALIINRRLHPTNGRDAPQSDGFHCERTFKVR